MLKGENIHLRALEPFDLETLYRWENDTNIWKVSQTITPFSKHVLSQYLANAHQDIFTAKQLRLIIEKEVGLLEQLIFLISILHIKEQALVFGLQINVIDRRDMLKKLYKLLIEYAFKQLQLKQIYCNISSA